MNIRGKGTQGRRDLHKHVVWASQGRVMVQECPGGDCLHTGFWKLLGFHVHEVSKPPLRLYFGYPFRYKGPGGDFDEMLLI